MALRFLIFQKFKILNFFVKYTLAILHALCIMISV